VVVLAAVLACGCARNPAAKVLASATEAVGGKDKIMALGTLTIEGEGTDPNLGQNLTPEAPLTVWKVTGFTESFEPEKGRMHIEQVRTAQFPFAMATSVKDNRSLDNDIAWDRDQDGNVTRTTERVALERRVELLHHPITILRAAFNPSAKVNNYRQRGDIEMIDVTTVNGDTVTLSVSKNTHLPVSVTSRADQANLGDVLIETKFLDYQDQGGLKLPTHLVSTIDKWTRSDIRVSKNNINAPVNLTAPDAMQAALAAPADPPVSVTVQLVSPGVWWLNGDGNHHSVVIEFSDHLTLFEVPTSDSRAKAVIEKARSLAFGKPLTDVVVSHHHFDHSAGIRAAAAEGLTIITQQGNLAFFKDLIARPHTIVPDELALALAPPPMQIKVVDDEVTIKDDTRELDLYHVKNNNHADTLLMGWLPNEHILIQADLYDSGWQRFPWADNLRENVELRKLKPEKDVPIHGKIEDWADVLKTMSARTTRK
jgi:glyoxylase-like metal-dependent hydrolase (beta-lactamase superfamily II)